MPQNKSGRPKDILNEEEEWVLEALDRPVISYINPGKNDNVYLGKINGKKKYEQKRYFLLLLKDIIDVLNGSELSDNKYFPQKFNRKFVFMNFTGSLNNTSNLYITKRFHITPVYVKLARMQLYLLKGWTKVQI